MSQQACIGKAAPQVGWQDGRHRLAIVKLSSQPAIANPAKHIIAHCKQEYLRTVSLWHLFGASTSHHASRVDVRCLSLSHV